MSKRDRRKRVAVVEDHDDIRLLMQLWLSQRFNVSCFENGEVLLSALDSVVPDLVVMDLNLPGRDGLQVIAELRLPGSRWIRLPILLLTGMPRGGLEAAISDAHTTFLSKPLQLSFLRDAIEGLLDGEAGQRAGAAHAR